MATAEAMRLDPWQPITDKSSLKHLGKLGEEANELSGIICRIIIQGMDEKNPDTQVVNRIEFENEIADVLANIELNVAKFGLNLERIFQRKNEKMSRLSVWHGAL